MEQLYSPRLMSVQDITTFQYENQIETNSLYHTKRLLQIQSHAILTNLCTLGISKVGGSCSMWAYVQEVFRVLRRHQSLLKILRVTTKE